MNNKQFIIREEVVGYLKILNKTVKNVITIKDNKGDILLSTKYDTALVNNLFGPEIIFINEGSCFDENDKQYEEWDDQPVYEKAIIHAKTIKEISRNDNKVTITLKENKRLITSNEVLDMEI